MDRARAPAPRRGAAHGALRCVAAALAALLGAAPAGAQYFGQNEAGDRRAERAVIASERFEVHYARGLDSLAVRVLDLAEQADTLLLRRLGHRPGRRVPVVLHGSPHGLAAADVAAGPAAAGGFTVVLRDHVELAFTGSHEELRCAVVHGLARAYVSDLLHGGPPSRRWAGRAFFAVPPWFSEGLAGHLSPGTDPDAEVFLRDGIVAGTLPPLERAGGYLAGVQGRSAVGYLAARHGEERLRELLRELRRTHGFDRAFRRVMGVPVRRFDEQWREALRRTYWPEVAARRAPEHFALRLTDHRRDGSTVNVAPAVSPQGDRVAWFSDRRRYADVYVMPVHDGAAPHRVARGGRSVPTAAVPSFRDAVAWSPDGRRLVLTATSGGRDVLCVVSAADARVLRRLRPDCDALAHPAWSPVTDSVVVTGLKDGQADLWLVDTGTGWSERLTRDAWDEKEPCWAPDGRTVTFASDRPAPIELRPERAPGGFGRYGLYDLDLAGRRIRERVVAAGDVHAPAWSPDGDELAFLSGRGCASDIVLLDTSDSSLTRLTEVLGGVSSLSWSRQDDRLVFSAFGGGGYDVFALRAPVSVDAVRARLRRERPQAVMSREEFAGGTSVEQDAPSARPDPPPARRPGPYGGRLAPAGVTGGMLAATGYGCSGTVQVAFGDLLGSHRVRLAADLPGRPLEETSVLLVYGWRPRRWEVSAGLFHLRDTYSAGFVPTGEALGSARILAGRSFGARAGASYPFDRFRRLEVGVSQSFVERRSRGDAGDGSPRPGERRFESVTSPAVSLVGDDALWGRTGPVFGGRWRLTFAPSLGWPGDGPAYRNLSLDARRYWDLGRGYVLAARLLAARSDGRDARAFEVGGFATLRGWPLYGLAGTRLALVNAELRFPFIDRFGVVGPLPLGRLALRGALFADAAMAWDRGEPLRFSRVSGGERRLDSPCLSFGAGVRTMALSLVLKLDAAWRTDLAGVERPRWEFSIGPEF